MSGRGIMFVKAEVGSLSFSLYRANSPRSPSMKSCLRRYAVHLLFVGALGFSVTGCATYAMNDVLRGPTSASYHYRIDQDVRRYVGVIDRRIRLGRRQEQNVHRLLRERTFRLLDRTRPSNHRRVYPFPRREYRRMNIVQRSFWRNVDRRIERMLTRAQARRYRGVFTQEKVRFRSRADRSDRRYGKRGGRRGDRENDRGRRD